MKTNTENIRRTKRIAKIISRDNGLTAEDAIDGITDLLTDIRHYCDARGLNFAACDKLAYQHYLEEKA